MTQLYINGLRVPFHATRFVRAANSIPIVVFSIRVKGNLARLPAGRSSHLLS